MRLVTRIASHTTQYWPSHAPKHDGSNGLFQHWDNRAASEYYRLCRRSWLPFWTSRTSMKQLEHFTKSHNLWLLLTLMPFCGFTFFFSLKHVSYCLLSHFCWWCSKSRRPKAIKHKPKWKKLLLWLCAFIVCKCFLYFISDWVDIHCVVLNASANGSI